MWLDLLIPYSSLITAVGSIFLLIVTLIYVYFTWKLQKISRSSFELGKQPCIFPDYELDFSAGSFEYNKESGWGMSIFINLKNVGDSPAISVYVFGKILTQYSQPTEINMIPAPRLVPNVTVTDSLKSVQLYFGKQELLQLIEEMNHIHNAHPEYIYTNKKSAHFGPILMINILYKNLLGIWFIGTFSRNIHYLKIIPKTMLEGVPKDQIFIPPCRELPQSGYEFIHLYVGGEDMSEIDIHSISEREAMRIIKNT